MKKLTQRDIAGILRIDTKTLYNWRKFKPELYRIVMLGFKVDEFLAKSKENLAELEDVINGEQKPEIKVQKPQKMKM